VHANEALAGYLRQGWRITKDWHLTNPFGDTDYYAQCCIITRRGEEAVLFRHGTEFSGGSLRDLTKI